MLKITIRYKCFVNRKNKAIVWAKNNVPFTTFE